VQRVYVPIQSVTFEVLAFWRTCEVLDTILLSIVLGAGMAQAADPVPPAEAVLTGG
jgi:hypothetical protein